MPTGHSQPPHAWPLYGQLPVGQSAHAGACFAPPAATLNAESTFTGFAAWHFGHSPGMSRDTLRINRSNRIPHFSHSYSKIGIASILRAFQPRPGILPFRVIKIIRFAERDRAGL